MCVFSFFFSFRGAGVKKMFSIRQHQQCEAVNARSATWLWWILMVSPFMLSWGEIKHCQNNIFNFLCVSSSCLCFMFLCTVDCSRERERKTENPLTALWDSKKFNWSLWRRSQISCSGVMIICKHKTFFYSVQEKNEAKQQQQLTTFSQIIPNNCFSESCYSLSTQTTFLEPFADCCNLCMFLS